MSREAKIIVTREEMDWMRFAADQLDVRARQFQRTGMRPGFDNCKRAAFALRELVEVWKAAP